MDGSPSEDERLSVYVLSLTPTGPDGPTVVAHLEIDGGRVRVVELTVRPGSAGTSLPGEVADLDFRLLAEQAAVMSTGGMPLAPAPRPGDGRQQPPDGASRGKAVESPPARPVNSRRRRAPEGSGSAVKGVPSDLAKVYWKLGSLAKVAAHYDVPRQIAQGWVKSLRDHGALPDPWSGSARRRR
jgi:hypothetical protein